MGPSMVPENPEGEGRTTRGEERGDLINHNFGLPAITKLLILVRFVEGMEISLSS